jgi:hypothetical protein
MLFYRDGNNVDLKTLQWCWDISFADSEAEFGLVEE